MILPPGVSQSALRLVALVAVALPAVGYAETLLFGTGFEAPTYPTGPIGGGYYSVPQYTSALGWYAWPVEAYSANPSPWAVVTGQQAASGSQALKLSIDPAANSSIGVSRNFAPNPLSLSGGGTERFGISLRLYLDQAANSDVSWSIGVADSYANLMGITLTPSGQVMYAHRYMNTAAFYNPGFDLRNTWLDVGIERNPADATSVLLTVASPSQSWQQVVSSPGGAATRFYVGGAWPTFPQYRSGTAYVDDLRLGYNLAVGVPEPSSAALLVCGVAGLVGGHWRRTAAALRNCPHRAGRPGRRAPSLPRGRPCATPRQCDRPCGSTAAIAARSCPARATWRKTALRPQAKRT